MFYESELRFLCNTFKKSRVKVSFVTVRDPVNKILDDSFLRIFGADVLSKVSLDELFEKINPYTVYRLKDSFSLCYMFLLLPQTNVSDTVLVFGPYLSENYDSRVLMEIGERSGISPQRQKLLENYYESMVVISEQSHLLVMLDTFCELIWGGSNAYTIIDVNKELLPMYTRTEVSMDKPTSPNEEAEDVLANMEIMEKRYEFENELILAVSRGQVHRVSRILQSFSESSFEKRIADPIRNLKNYGIIMNTLLRKAAEKGGVHPFHLHNMSSTFAVKIEQIQREADMQSLMQEMLESYCRLVRKYSMKNYSTIVRKTISLINADLSANLSLSSLAEPQNISPGYLSTVFKKETGKTVTEYILNERMQLAIHLLSTTRLQVQTVALHCGIMDVQYFSKVFKKHTGKTPNEYRKSIK